MKNLNPIKNQFPFFESNPKLTYLDSAATTQKPRKVIDRIKEFYTSENSNIHRGVYELSYKATENYENVRTKVAKFLNTNPGNIAFTKGTTDSINLVANSIAKDLTPSSNLVTTIAEHHANFIPWQVTSKKNNSEFRVCPIKDDLRINLEALESLCDKNSKILAINHISNTTGIINPLDKILRVAEKNKIPVLIDAAQSASMHKLDVKELGCDFLTFSMHKAFGPFGVGILYVSDRFIDRMEPLFYGGGAVKQVGLESTNLLDFPHSMEAGTQAIAEVIASGAAIEFIEDHDLRNKAGNIAKLEESLRETIKDIGELRVLGDALNGSGIVSFYHPGIHPHDLASALSTDGIAVRAGLHCTQPLLAALNIPATIRVSLSIYNDLDDIEKLNESLRKAIRLLA